MYNDDNDNETDDDNDIMFFIDNSMIIENSSRSEDLATGQPHN